MKVDTSFLIVVVIALLFLSAMIVLQLTAAGVGKPRIVTALVELWVLMALWIAIFSSLGAAVGTPEGPSGPAELRGLASRLAELPPPVRIRLAVGLAASVGLAAHLIWSLGRAGGRSRPTDGKGGG